MNESNYFEITGAGFIQISEPIVAASDASKLFPLYE